MELQLCIYDKKTTLQILKTLEMVGFCSFEHNVL